MEIKAIRHLTLQATRSILAADAGSHPQQPGGASRA
jgi:hypothetical protein